MSVTRFVPYAEPEFPWYSGIEEREDGEYVLYTDYAALEARCAGMKRERDAAVTSRDGYLGSIEKMAEERDAIQSKLAAAVEALRDIPASYDPDCDCTECSEFRTRVGAILAGHAPATKGEVDE